MTVAQMARDRIGRSVARWLPATISKLLARKPSQAVLNGDTRNPTAVDAVQLARILENAAVHILVVGDYWGYWRWKFWCFSFLSGSYYCCSGRTCGHPRRTPAVRRNDHRCRTSAFGTFHCCRGPALPRSRPWCHRSAPFDTYRRRRGTVRPHSRPWWWAATESLTFDTCRRFRPAGNCPETCAVAPGDRTRVARRIRLALLEGHIGRVRASGTAGSGPSRPPAGS